MASFLRGHLCGYLCDDCEEPLARAVVRAYRPGAGGITRAVAADPKETAALLDADAVTAKAARLLAEATVDEHGSFRLQLPDDAGDEAIELDVFVTPMVAHGRDDAPMLQLHVTTLQPKFRVVEEGPTAAFDWCIPARLWCLIRGIFGLWTVCGTVTMCETHQPVAGVLVKAFDRDWLQDDPIGSAVTDVHGHYRIDYTYGDFRRTPFSPLINIEWFGGPDLYFHVEGPGGTPLLVEPSSMGRTPGRENVGPCACIDLCLTGDVPGTPPTIPMFTKVGQYRIDPLFGEFTGAGTTTAGEYAFTGDLPLVGIMPDPLSPQAIEYRFLISGAVVTAAEMAPTLIGELQYFAWDAPLSAWVVRTADFWANNPGATVSIPQSSGPDLVVPVDTPVKADGWIEAPRVNGLVPGGPGRFIPNGNLARLRTTAYTDESFDLRAGAPPLPLDAGDSVPLAHRSAKPTFSIEFQARLAPGGAMIGTNVLPTIAFSNVEHIYTRHPYWAGGDVTTLGVASLGIAEMVGAGGCAELGDQIHVLFTSYHPYSGQPRIHFDGNPILPPDIVPTTTDGHAVSPAGGQPVDISLLAKCAYILWLDVPLRLTSGFGSLGYSLHDHIGFCKA